jgi:murein DD-endopeptidase MepM/ murein hydrolase activator NlpD
MRLKRSIFLFLCFLLPAMGFAQEDELPDTVDVEEVDSSEFVSEDNLDLIEADFDLDERTALYIDSMYGLNRRPGINFDSSIIPALQYYSLWDTIVINPYNEDLSNMEEQVPIALQDDDDCYFFPPCRGDITSGFGFRRWGRRVKFHYGVDVRLYTGDPVYAAFDGVVRVAKLSADYGYVVLIRHYNGFETLYAHFSRLMTSTGATVRAGDVIGLGGSTGHSTGSHLHFEIRFKGEKIDPTRLICFPENRLYQDTVFIDKTYFAHKLAVNKVLAKAKYGKYHIVRRGDTLAHIAYRYGTTVSRLCQINRIRRTSILQAGKRIRVR